MASPRTELRLGFQIGFRMIRSDSTRTYRLTPGMDTRPLICDYEGFDYQGNFWDRGHREYEDRVEAIALQRLLRRSGERLLEVGAGAGRHAPRYSAFQHVVLLDHSTSQLRQARERLGQESRYDYVVADAYHLPFVRGSFDAATMIRALHHMTEPPATLREVRRVLQAGALFVLEYANKRNLKAIFRWLTRRQPWSPFDRQPIEFAPLHFDFHPAAIRHWLNEAGFQIGRQLTVSHFRVGLLKRVVPLAWLVHLDSLFQLTGQWFQFTPSVFVQTVAVNRNPADVSMPKGGSA